MPLTRETTHITRTTINRAVKMAKDGKSHEISDTAVKRLSIRIRSGSATWTLRLRLGEKQTTRSIGSVDLFKDPERVRALALRGKELGAKGEDPAPLFEGARLEGSGELDAAETEAERRSGDGWTWEQMLEKYLAAAAVRRPDTVRSYRSALSLPDFAPFHGKLLFEITEDDVRKVRDSIVKRGKRRQAESSLQQIRQSFSWAIDQSDSGIKFNPAATVSMGVFSTPSIQKEDALRDAGRNEPFRRYLSKEELGLILWELDTLNRKEFALALTIQMFTAQRRATVASAIKRSFVDDPDWGLVWVIHPGVRKKTKQDTSRVYQRPHAIPLPPTAAVAVREAMKLSRRDSPWLFPQTKKRRATDSGDGHIAPRTLNEKLYELQNPGRRLHSDTPFATHVFRYSFSTHLSELQVPQQHRQLVMDHREGTSDSTEDLHYNADPSMPDKLNALTIWHDLIIEQMEKYAPGEEVA